MDDQQTGSGPALPPRLDLRKSGILKAKAPDAVSPSPVSVAAPAEVSRISDPAVPVPAPAVVIAKPAPMGGFLRPVPVAAAPAAPATQAPAMPRIAMPAPVQAAAAPAFQPPAPPAPAVPVSAGPKIAMPTPMAPQAQRPIPAVPLTGAADGKPMMPGLGPKPAGTPTVPRPVAGIGPRAPGVLSARPPLGGTASSPSVGPIKLTRPTLRAETPLPVEEVKPQAGTAGEPEAKPAADSEAPAVISVVPEKQAPDQAAKPAVQAVKAPGSSEQATIKLVRKTIPGTTKPIPSAVQTQAGIAAKKQTSKISLDQAVQTPGKLAAVSGTAADVPAQAAAPASPLIKKTTLNMSDVSDAIRSQQSQDAMVNDKRKTSRISLEAVLAAETSEVKKGSSAPSTIKLKRPTDSAGIKIGAPKSPASPGATVSLSQTSKLDEAADDSASATKKKTIKIRKPGAPSEGGAPAVSGSSGFSGTPGAGQGGERSQSTAPVYKESTGSKAFSVISIVLTAAAMIVISVTIYMFTSQCTGFNACLTETSYNPVGANLGWGTKIMPVQ